MGWCVLWSSRRRDVKIGVAVKLQWPEFSLLNPRHSGRGFYNRLHARARRRSSARKTTCNLLGGVGLRHWRTRIWQKLLHPYGHPTGYRSDTPPGEKEPGTFHYNPGNMSGKTVGSHKDDTDQRSNKAGTIHNLNKEQQNKTDN